LSAEPQIGVIGAGAWGTALAQALASDGSAVTLWAREAELVAEINGQRTNSLFLPSARLADSIRATGDIADLASLPVLLAVVPAQFLGSVLGQLRRNARSGAVRQRDRGRNRAADERCRGSDCPGIEPGRPVRAHVCP